MGNRYRVSTNLTEQISGRFQQGFQEKSRACLHCFSLVCNVPNLLVCLNIEQKHDMHNMGAMAKIKRATSFLNKRSGTQFHHDWKPMQSIIDILHKNFQEDKFKEISSISRRVFKFQEISRSCRHPALRMAGWAN